MRKARSLLLTIAVFGLAACQSTVQQTEPASEPAANTPNSSAPVLEPARPQGNSRELTEQAIAALQNGQDALARELLTASLSLNPEGSVASKLLAQLDANPESYLGARSFTYRVEDGDTLAGIADEYLGDWLQFPILARYNAIANPARIEPGQSLRIPYPKDTGAGTVSVTSKGLISPTQPDEDNLIQADDEETLVDETESEALVDVEEALAQEPPAAGDGEEVLQTIVDEEALAEEALAAEIRAGQEEEGVYPPSSDSN